MAITITRMDTAGHGWNDTASTSATTGSISPGANCFLVALVTGTDNGPNGELQMGGSTCTSSGSGPTWTLRANSPDPGSGNPYEQQSCVWTAEIGGSDPGGFTVTWTANVSGSNTMGCLVLSVWKFTGYDTGTPYAGEIAVKNGSVGNGSVDHELGAAPASGDVVVCQVSADEDSASCNDDITFDSGGGARTWANNYGASDTNHNHPYVTATSTGSTEQTIEILDLNPSTANDYNHAAAAIIVKDSAATGSLPAGRTRTATRVMLTR